LCHIRGLTENPLAFAVEDSGTSTIAIPGATVDPTDNNAKVLASPEPAHLRPGAISGVPRGARAEWVENLVSGIDSYPAALLGPLFPISAFTTPFRGR
jgi:hypothetical protein